MTIHECKSSIDSLSATLEQTILNYNLAIDENAGFNARKEIRNEMRRLGEEIIVLKKKLKDLELNSPKRP